MYQMKWKKIFQFSVFIFFIFINLSAITISEIQGSGDSSPYDGQRVTTEGNIVTFFSQFYVTVSGESKLADGFFIQSPANLEDGNIETSEGVYVFAFNSGVKVGDIVNITADVSEYYYLTELSNADVTIVSSGNSLPEPIILDENSISKTPSGNLSQWEKYEGMLVQLSDGYVTGPSDSYEMFMVNPFGERTFNEQGIKYPGINDLPVWDGNPEVVGVEISKSSYTGTEFKAGTLIDFLKGPLTYTYGDYKIIPSELTYTDNTTYPRPVRDPLSDEILIGTQNMLRLSSSDSDTKFEKLSLQVRENLKAPDILAVQEVFDIDTLEKLANQIHNDDNSINYSAYLVEGNSSDIDSGFLVRENVTVNNIVQLFKDEKIQSGSNFYPLHDRPPLLIECTVEKNSKSVSLTVICIHNRSLNDVDSKDFVREKRFRQAEDIAEYVDSLLDADPNKNIVVTGDFNCYQFTDGYVDGLGMITGNLDPKGAMLEGEDLVDIDLRNQIYSLPFEERYSYVHEGNSSALDHMLTSFNLNKYVVEIQYARGNADLPESFENVAGSSLRSSDHDGLVMYLNFETELGAESVLPLSGNLTEGMVEDANCFNYFVNTSGVTGNLTITELDSDDSVLNEIVKSLSAGEKVNVNDLVENSNLSNLKISSEFKGSLISEVVTNTGQMTSYILNEMGNTKYVPHIAEQIAQWDSFLYLSSPEKSDVNIDVANDSGIYQSNFSYFDNVEKYLGTSNINFDTAYGTLTSTSNSFSGFEIFKENGHDGAATELINEGSKILYIPHIPTEDLFWTGFAFLNPTNTEINSKVTLFDSNGNSVYTHEFKVPANTKIVNVVEGIFPGVEKNAQWGIVESDGKLIGIEIYGTTNFLSICGFSLTGDAYSDGILPLLYKGEGLWTGIAFANPDIETAFVKARLYGKDGTLKEEKSFSIEPKKRYAFVADTLFANELIENTDYVTFYSEKPVIAIEVSGDLDRTFMTALGAKGFRH